MDGKGKRNGWAREEIKSEGNGWRVKGKGGKEREGGMRGNRRMRGVKGRAREAAGRVREEKEGEWREGRKERPDCPNSPYGGDKCRRVD